MSNKRQTSLSLVFIAIGVILTSQVFAVPHPNDRSGTWVTYQSESTYPESIEACNLAAAELSKSSNHFRFMGQHFSHVGQSYFCNLDVIEYLPKEREYLRNLNIGADFDFERSRDLEYVKNYFQLDLNILAEWFAPFQVEVLRHGLTSDSKHAYFLYEVSYPEDFVSNVHYQRIWVDASVQDPTYTEADAIEKRNLLESLLTQVYSNSSLEIHHTGVDEIQHGNPGHSWSTFEGWISYRVEFPARNLSFTK
jgi:hypothetical protein